MDKSQKTPELETKAADKWVKCISTQGNVRGVAIHATHLARELAAMHGLNGFAAQALGETAIGALLISSFCKGGEKVNLNIRGTGRIQQALADATADGTVRGYVIARETDSVTPVDAEKQLGPWGEGLLAVLRTKKSEGQQPYIGTVPLLTGHLAKDLTFYWAQSEQIPSAVGLAVNFKDGQIHSAGGFLIQTMPGASALEVRQIEQHINEISSYADSIARDADPLQLLSQVFQDTAFVVLEEKPIRFECTCNVDRVRRALMLTGVEELRSMIADQNGAEVHCDFCAKNYQFDRAALEALIQAGSDTN